MRKRNRRWIDEINPTSFYSTSKTAMRQIRVTFKNPRRFIFEIPFLNSSISSSFITPWIPIYIHSLEASKRNYLAPICINAGNFAIVAFHKTFPLASFQTEAIQ